MYLKLGIIIPVMTVFVMNFNTEIVAQQKAPSAKEIEIHEEVEMITKDFSESDLEKLKSNLLKQGIELEYKKLKYNDAKEITGIELSVSNNKGNKAKLSQNGDEPISPISIRFDSKNGTLALGNMGAPHAEHVWVHKSGSGDGHKEIHKKIIVDTGGEKEVIVIGGDGANSFTHEDIDIEVSEDGNVWVSDSGDSTKVKHVKVITLDEDVDSDGSMKIMIRKGEPGSKEVNVKVKTLSGGDGEKDFFFISDGDEKPLMIIDGKEMPDAKMEDLDHENIETIEVLKGDKAVEKYGEKAKNGVVIIKTKK